jgi:hypothetical protein
VHEPKDNNAGSVIKKKRQVVFMIFNFNIQI